MLELIACVLHYVPDLKAVKHYRNSWTPLRDFNEFWIAIK